MTTQEQVKDVVSQVLADKADKGGIKRVVWIGAGGSNGGNYPAQYFMEHEATQVVSSSYTSNEFVHATPAYVNENTLAVVVSMRGTKETIVAAQVAMITAPAPSPSMSTSPASPKSATTRSSMTAWPSMSPAWAAPTPPS